MNAWKPDVTRILTKSEIATVLTDLHRRGRRSVNARMNLAIFRLATCCGLRASEVSGIRVGDVRASVAKPYINVPKSVSKGRRSRRVPLWWDRGTLADIQSWRDQRIENGASKSSRFRSRRFRTWT